MLLLTLRVKVKKCLKKEAGKKICNNKFSQYKIAYIVDFNIQKNTLLIYNNLRTIEQ
ncbi:hypothetical protein EMIT019CA3_30091 [Bacillus pseudomycoides]